MIDVLDSLPSPSRLASLAEIHRHLAEVAGLAPSAPVRCRVCGFKQRVDGATAMRFGWPKHCGQTMFLVTPGTAGDADRSAP